MAKGDKDDKDEGPRAFSVIWCRFAGRDWIATGHRLLANAAAHGLLTGRLREMPR